MDDIERMECAIVYKRFCQEVLDNLNGNKNSEWFCKACGLCANLSDFIVDNFSNGFPLYMKIYQKELFKTDHGNSSTPFNHGALEYMHEINRYINPLRMAHLRKYGEGEIK